MASESAGIMIVAEPLLNVVAEDVYPPSERVTVPVGVELDPETVTVTERGCATVMVYKAATKTFGVIWTGAVTVTDIDPLAGP
jgi:hypothetical protein